MTGSNTVAIVTPIVALITLAFWLSLCFYAGSHPFWRGQRPPHQEQPAGRDQLASRPQPQPGTLPPPATQGLPGTADPKATAAGPQREAHG